jgi:hypothetical protein
MTTTTDEGRSLERICAEIVVLAVVACERAVAARPREPATRAEKEAIPCPTRTS